MQSPPVINEVAVNGANNDSFDFDIGEEAAAPPTPRTSQRKRLRWLALGLISGFAIGAFYCWDSIPLMNEEILAVYGVDQTKFNLILTFQYLPEMVLSLLGAAAI